MKPDKTSGGTDHKQKDAAAAIARERVLNSFKAQLDNYTTDQPEPAKEKIADDTTAAKLSHAKYTTDLNENVAEGIHQSGAKDLDAYHRAWQDYYRRYYEAYYSSAVSKVAAQSAKSNASQKHTSRDEADKLDQKAAARKGVAARAKHHAKTKARKFRRSRHFVPIIAGLVVVLAFLFMQYNRNIVGAINSYIMPTRVNTAIIPPDGIVNIPVGDESVLIIPSINVRVPIVFNVALDHASQMAGMERGAIHFSIPGANSMPGQVGNFVLSAHSSNDVFAPGDYKFIFAQLERMEDGETFFVEHEGIRYTYVMTRSEVVLPNNVGALIYDTHGKPVITLITCVPVGTARYRLLVTGEQVSPSPDNAKPAPVAPEPGTEPEITMPATSATLLQRIWSFITGNGWPAN